VGVAVLVEAELQGVLDGHQTLGRGDLGAQGPEHGGLAGGRPPRHEQVPAGHHAGTEERSKPGVEGAHAHQVIQGELGEPVAADRDAGSAGDGHDREQSAPVGQLQVEPRRGQVEAAF